MPHPMSNDPCLKCHNGAKRFMAEDSHIGADNKTLPDLLTDSTRCVECHKRIHDVPTKQAARPSGAG